MAIKRIDLVSELVTDTFQSATTDLVSAYPTDCGIGSQMIVIDETIHKVDHYMYFDGVNWNTM